MTDQELLAVVNRCLRYDDGRLYWVDKPSPFSRMVIGIEAGYLHNNGYRCVKIVGKRYHVHRIIALMHGLDTSMFIDHIDGNPLNNRIENLRSCVHKENAANRKLNTNSTSRYKNVIKHGGKWRVEIQVNGDRKYLFGFNNPKDAFDASVVLRAECFGEFARDF